MEIQLWYDRQTDDLIVFLIYGCDVQRRRPLQEYCMLLLGYYKYYKNVVLKNWYEKMWIYFNCPFVIGIQLHFPFNVASVILSDHYVLFYAGIWIFSFLFHKIPCIIQVYMTNYCLYSAEIWIMVGNPKAVSWSLSCILDHKLCTFMEYVPNITCLFESMTILSEWR